MSHGGFSKANIDGANFIQANVNGVDFSNSVLKKISFNGVRMCQVTLANGKVVNSGCKPDGECS